jgi:hypothetical protein
MREVLEAERQVLQAAEAASGAIVARARVVCESGWSAWVDGRLLEPWS